MGHGVRICMGVFHCSRLVCAFSRDYTAPSYKKVLLVFYRGEDIQYYHAIPYHNHIQTNRTRGSRCPSLEA